MVKVFGPGVERTGLKANEPTHFTVDCSGAGDGETNTVEAGNPLVLFGVNALSICVGTQRTINAKTNVDPFYIWEEFCLSLALSCPSGVCVEMISSQKHPDRKPITDLPEQNGHTITSHRPPLHAQMMHHN